MAWYDENLNITIFETEREPFEKAIGKVTKKEKFSYASIDKWEENEYEYDAWTFAAESDCGILSNTSPDKVIEELQEIFLEIACSLPESRCEIRYSSTYSSDGNTCGFIANFEDQKLVGVKMINSYANTCRMCGADLWSDGLCLSADGTALKCPDCDEENAIDDMGEAEIEYIRMKLVGTEWEPLTEDDSSEYDETFDED